MSATKKKQQNSQKRFITVQTSSNKASTLIDGNKYPTTSYDDELEKESKMKPVNRDQKASIDTSNPSGPMAVDERKVVSASQMVKPPQQTPSRQLETGSEGDKLDIIRDTQKTRVHENNKTTIEDKIYI